jgi:hypothetical protein
LQIQLWLVCSIAPRDFSRIYRFRIGAIAQNKIPIAKPAIAMRDLEQKDRAGSLLVFVTAQPQVAAPRRMDGADNF